MMNNVVYSGLDQHGTEPFEQQQFGTAGVEGVRNIVAKISTIWNGCVSYISVHH